MANIGSKTKRLAPLSNSGEFYFPDPTENPGSPDGYTTLEELKKTLANLTPWDMSGATTGIGFIPSNNYNATISQVGTQSRLVPSDPIPEAVPSSGAYLAICGTEPADIGGLSIPFHLGQYSDMLMGILIVHPATLSTSDVINKIFANDYSDLAIIQCLYTDDSVAVIVDDVSDYATGITFSDNTTVTISVSEAGIVSVSSEDTPTPFNHPTTLPGDLSNFAISFGIYSSVPNPTRINPYYVEVGSQEDATLPASSVNGDLLEVSSSGIFDGYEGAVGDIVKILDKDNDKIAIWRTPSSDVFLTKDQADSLYDSFGSAASVQVTLSPQITSAQNTADNALTAANNAESNSKKWTINYMTGNITGVVGKTMYLRDAGGSGVKYIDINEDEPTGDSGFNIGETVRVGFRYGPSSSNRSAGVLFRSGVTVNTVTLAEDVQYVVTDPSEYLEVTRLYQNQYSVIKYFNEGSGVLQGIQNAQATVDLNEDPTGRTMATTQANLSSAPQESIINLPVFTSSSVYQDRKILVSTRSYNTAGAYSKTLINFHGNTSEYGAVLEVLAYPHNSNYRYANAEIGVTAQYSGSPLYNSRRLISYSGDTVLQTDTQTGRTAHGHSLVRLITFENTYTLTMSEYGPLHAYNADGVQYMTTSYVTVVIENDIDDFTLTTPLQGDLISNEAYKAGDEITVRYQPNGVIELSSISRASPADYVADADTTDLTTTAASIDALRDALVAAGIMKSS